MDKRCTCHMPVWVKNPMYHASDCALVSSRQPEQRAEQTIGVIISPKLAAALLNAERRRNGYR